MQPEADTQERYARVNSLSKSISHAQLIDLQGIDALHGIRLKSDAIVLGAMTRHADVADHPEIGSALPALAQLAGGIGDPLVRNMGTIGGSIANNDPAADYPAAILGLNATVTTDRRDIAADEFFRMTATYISRRRFPDVPAISSCRIPPPAT